MSGGSATTASGGGPSWRLIWLMLALIVTRAIDQVLYYRLATVLGACRRVAVIDIGNNRSRLGMCRIVRVVLFRSDIADRVLDRALARGTTSYVVG